MRPAGVRTSRSGPGGPAATLVRTAQSGRSSWKVPKLSSASTTSHSPVSHTALVPTSFTSAPMRNEGRTPASIKMRDSIDAQVVLPFVPATARQRRVAQMAASMPDRGTTPAPASAAATISGLVGATAGEKVTESTRPTFSAR